jgi:hypothetical protein
MERLARVHADIVRARRESVATHRRVVLETGAREAGWLDASARRLVREVVDLRDLVERWDRWTAAESVPVPVPVKVDE